MVQDELVIGGPSALLTEEGQRTKPWGNSDDGAPCDKCRGVTVFPRVEGLHHYMEANDADLDDCLIVELDGEPSGEVDFDADQGAMLVIPTGIVACHRAAH